VTYRNRKLLDAVRELPCQACGVQDGTVCAAHRNEGKGMGKKVSDALIAALCFRCHQAVDQGAAMTREERRDAWNRAAIKTYQALIEKEIVRVA
jgi:hypothetical protein